MSNKNDVVTNEEIIEVNVEEPKMGLAGKIAAKVANLSNKVVEKSIEKAEKKAANSKKNTMVREVVTYVVAGTAVAGGIIAYYAYKVISGKAEDTTVDVECSDNGFTVTEVQIDRTAGPV